MERTAAVCDQVATLDYSRHYQLPCHGPRGLSSSIDRSVGVTFVRTRARARRAPLPFFRRMVRRDFSTLSSKNKNKTEREISQDDAACGHERNMWWAHRHVRDTGTQLMKGESCGETSGMVCLHFF